MPTIPQLTATDSVSAGDLVAVWSQNNGDSRKAAMSVLQAYMQNSLTFQDGIPQFVTQHFLPPATGFNAVITDGQDNNSNVHLILQPAAAFAAGTITLPPKASVVDKQQVLVNSTKSVTALTIDPNGVAAVIGAPTTLAANDFFTLKYDILNDAWFRIG